MIAGRRGPFIACFVHPCQIMVELHDVLHGACAREGSENLMVQVHVLEPRAIEHNADGPSGTGRCRVSYAQARKFDPL